ncbi:DNA primase small subunit [Galdieria sulphuraria]|uniref:DNA primase n=1 Tax=Galdieria sulphuraria TaxID=130081 RepID=M2WZT7_GALSU|nr:DNA primase small subunit [Galdieria sulphuraria]EME29595.1 DNA primase small subunit [Galdieria sulphuraria]|eukprot:XP_005706115.1 DNA primase small subunit [Galdieria sulphuraria]
MSRRQYYQEFFPVDLIVRWLSYSFQRNKQLFERRELSFTLDNEIYVRYQSFESAEDLRKVLVQKLPVKIDIGAVYNYPPCNQSLVTLFAPLERELIFDIDLTDYEDVAIMKSEDEVDLCDNNWYLIAAAVELLDKALRDDFGFQHILWVYSGRRGVHGWICDERARKLSDECRDSILEYLTVRLPSALREISVKREKSNVSVCSDDSLRQWNTLSDPFLKRSFDYLYPLFLKYVVQSPQFFSDENHFKKYLSLIPSHYALQIERLIESNTVGMDLWERVEEMLKEPKKSCFYGLVVCLVFHYLYPRLDANVSRHMNHLLKSPFCLHPKTQRVCVPFSANEVWTFQPSRDAPQISDENLGLDSNDKFVLAKQRMKNFIEDFERIQKLENINANEQKLFQRHDFI